MTNATNDKEEKKQVDNPIFNKLDISAKFIYPEIEEQRQKRKKRSMTYIISGKYKNNPFLMVDCVASGEVNNTKVYKFRNKLKKLISTESETYFCLTGSELYQHAIEAFDEKCYWNERNFDFKNPKHIKEVIELFKLICEAPNYSNINIEKFCRIYFVDKEEVYYYQIDDGARLTCAQDSTHLYKIPNNCFIEPNYADNYTITIERDFENIEEIVEFCKNKILALNAYNGLDLKDKFSYIIFDNNAKLTNNSFKNNNEIVLSMIAGDYNELK